MNFDYNNLTGAHVRAARGLLDWYQDDLARESGVSKKSIQNIEADKTVGKTVKLELYETFSKLGMEFFNGDAPGVRLHMQCDD